MYQAQARRSGNSFVITIPKAEVERLNVREGQFFAIEMTPMELKPILRPELAEAFERTEARSTPVMKWLKDK